MGNVVKIDTEDIRIMATFERLTRTSPKDCIITPTCVYFLVNSDKIGLAIGKGGSVIKDVIRVLGRPVKLFEYSDDVATFVKNMIPSAETVEISGDEIKISLQAKDKSAVIGKGGRNIQAIKEFLKRQCNINNVRLK